MPKLSFHPALPPSLLNTLDPMCFRYPRMFQADHDTELGNQKQYERGLEVGRESEYVTICKDGTWSARSLEGVITTSYERIGYHSGTAALLQGFLDSGVEMYVDRYDHGSTRIQ